jgi:hypothetical protein
VARTRKSVFCSVCKRHLANAVEKAMRGQYKFPQQFLCHAAFDPREIAYEEGYLYGLLLQADLEARAELGEVSGFELTEIGEHTRGMIVTEMETYGFTQSFIDGVWMVLAGKKLLREKLVELAFHYLKRINYRYPYHPALRQGLEMFEQERAVKQPQLLTTEIDEICEAIEIFAEKM